MQDSEKNQHPLQKLTDLFPANTNHENPFICLNTDWYERHASW